MKNKALTITLGCLLVGCQTTTQIGKNTEEVQMKKFEEDASFIEKREIKKWVSSKYTSSYIKSDNFNERKPTILLLHHTDSNEDAAAVQIFKEGKVSSHYLISRTGEVIQFVDETKRAFHAGDSYWHGFEDINSSSIGIELSNDIISEYTEEQIQSLINLSKDIMKRYDIRPDMVIGHLDIAPGRKQDPYLNFPWERLAKEGIGLTCSTEEVKKTRLPKGFDWKRTLEDLGYNPNILNKSLASFRIKHFKSLEEGLPTLKEKKYMYCLVEKINKSRFN